MQFIKRTSKKSKKGYTWSVRFNYVDFYGRTKQFSKSGFETKQEAEKFGRHKKEEIEKNGGLNFRCEKTFNEVFIEFMNIKGQYDYSSATQQYYMNNFKNHIQNSKIGNAKIRTLGYVTIQSYFNKLDNLSLTTNKNIKKVFSATFRYALSVHYVDENPMTNVRFRGQDTSKEKTVIEYTQFKALIDSLLTTSRGRRPTFNTYSIVVFLYLGYFLGLRKSETLALEKSDVDFEAKTIWINKKIVYHGLKTNEIYATNEMKTKSSNAVLPIPDELLAVLQKWFKYNHNKVICCREDGKYMNPYDIDCVLRKHARKLGFEFHAHMLRHTYITNLAKNKENTVKIVSQLARHARVSTTMDVYVDEFSLDDKTKAVNSTFNSGAYKN